MIDCDVSKNGRLIALWIDEDDFDKTFTKFDQHVGTFWD